MVVNNLSHVHNTASLELNLETFINFNPRSMHNTQIPNKELSVFTDQHKLTLPQFLIIEYLVMIQVTLAHFVEGVATVV